MSRYHEQTHAHRGINVDGSKQIEYADIMNTPTIADQFDITVENASLASTVSVPNGTWTKITFNSGSWSSGVFTVPSGGAGIYQIKVRCYFSGAGTSGSVRALRIDVNGTRTDYDASPIVDTDSCLVEITRELSVGDTVDSYLYQDGGSTASILASTYLTNADIIKLS